MISPMFQSTRNVLFHCFMYGIRLYTCKYSPMCSLRVWKLLVPASTSVPYCIALVTSLIYKENIIMSHFVDVHKILQLVIFAVAIIIFGMFGPEVLHFQCWPCGIILLMVGHLRDLCVYCSIVLCDSYCLILSSLFLSVYVF